MRDRTSQDSIYFVLGSLAEAEEKRSDARANFQWAIREIENDECRIEKCAIPVPGGFANGLRERRSRYHKDIVIPQETL